METSIGDIGLAMFDIVKGGGLGQWWVVLHYRWYFWPTGIVKGGGLGRSAWWRVILLGRWYFWPTMRYCISF